MSVIPESGMNFGKYDEKDLFHIETSEIYKKLGDGIPTVEFILKYNGNNIVFLEAKKSCPNVANRYESKEKEQKFEEYYGSITEKFISSLQIYLAAIMNRYQETSEIGDNLRSVSNMKDVKLKEGKLADLAPTMLDIMGLEKPAEMTGESLIVKE